MLAQAFINLQAFVTSLLPAVGASAFHPWAYTFTLRMVAASGRLPQLSGFYHIITTAMQLADSAGLLGPQVHDCHVDSVQSTLSSLGVTEEHLLSSPCRCARICKHQQHHLQAMSSLPHCTRHLPNHCAGGRRWRTRRLASDNNAVSASTGPAGGIAAVF